jgi:hypothetical protein
MDEITELKRIWESLESRLASMDGDQTREYTVYCAGQNIGKTLMIDSDKDSDDIINDMIDEKILIVIDEETGTEYPYHFETYESGTDEEIEIFKVYDNDEIPDEKIYTLKTFDEIEDFDDFMENILDISREQYLSSGKWITKEYTLVTGTGGPHTEFTTGYQINVYWGGKSQEFTTYNDSARATIDRIEDYLNDCYQE